MKLLLRYFLIFEIALFGLVSNGQTLADNQALLKADYSTVQNNLYKIANSNSTFKTKQVETFKALDAFIRQYPKAENNLFLLAAAVNLTLPQLDSLIGILDTSLNNAPYKSNVTATKQRITIAETGKLFPAINLKDTLGNITSIESYKGNVVLLDFWSSWCAPCRQQIPGLLKIYKKYNGKGFEIIGISMDADKDAWLNAIAKDKQTWKQFCELVKFSDNKTARYFSIYGIPANFLLDKNGVIIGQDLSPDQIANMLNKF